MENEVFSESSPVMKDKFQGDVYIDEKMLVGETAINIDPTQLNKCARGDQTKQYLISTDITSELSPLNEDIVLNTDIKRELSNLNLYNTMKDDNIKIESDFGDVRVEFNNKQIFYNNCNEYYEENCAKCGMLICILNGSGPNSKMSKEIPANILEIKEGAFIDTSVFALKTIPKGVKFGPFTGFSTAESSWRLKGGKLVVGNDRSEFLNWMQYVNGARTVFDQNLHAFQYEGNLYYISTCEIQEGDELLVYFGEEYEESLSNNIEMDFMPHIETDVKNVFACTYCCLGFSSKVYLVEHKTVCSNGANRNFGELVQCPFCKIYLEKEEYLECHEIYCRKGNAKYSGFPALDNPILEEKSLSHVANERKKFNFTHFKCGICYKRFSKEESLKLHVENIHIAIKHKHSVRGYSNVNNKNREEKILDSHGRKQFKSLKCQFQRNHKHALKPHMKSKHHKEYNFNCTECDYKTNYKTCLLKHIKIIHLKEYKHNCTKCEFKTKFKKSLLIHIKSQHLKEYNYNCIQCKFKTNHKVNLEVHIKTKHLKKYDHSCLECEYKTNKKRSFQLHMKSKHLKEYDYYCMECEFKTNYKSDLAKHMKNKHLKECDYSCTKCEYNTSINGNLQRHIKTMHLQRQLI